MSTSTNSKSATPRFLMKPRQVPNFSYEAIRLADICAREIWVGNVYKKNDVKLEAEIEIEFIDSHGVITLRRNQTVVSDEVFLHLFAPYYIQHGGRDINVLVTFPNAINDCNLKAYIKVARLEQREMRSLNFNLNNGIDYLLTDALTEYRRWARSRTPYDFTALTAKMVQDFSLSMTTNPQNGVGSHTTAASRILFIAMPDLPFFNMSADIYTGLSIRADNNNIHIAKYYKALADGLRRNWQVLSSFEMPRFALTNDELWKRIRQSGWWQRRIYDLALKNYYSNSPIELNETARISFLTKPYMHL